jgi:lipid II:glycine glycyltransferase (peptidoglycan interpeptide bridge formation enzyme)
MSLIIEKKILGCFRTKNIWFSPSPYEVKGVSSVTFQACDNKVEAFGFVRKEFPTLIIDLSQDTNTIWRKMKKSSCQYAINQAIKKGVEVKVNQDYEEFYQIYFNFIKKKKLHLEFKTPDEIKNYGTLFVAKVKEEVIAGNLYLEDKENIRWLIGASKRLETIEKEKKILIGNANRLLIWEAIKYAKNKGIKKFDLGGYYTGGDKNDPRYTINKFKESFGGKITIRYIYQKNYSFLYSLLYKLYEIKNWLKGISE